jgi:hypothetical protein
MKKRNGGPAFPKAIGSYRDANGITRYNDHQMGMTLRDYFAAKAMQAIISKLPIVDMEAEFGKPINDKIKYNLDIADSAYKISDAMLEARLIDKEE